MKQKEKHLKFWIVAFIILSGVALFASCEKYTYQIETVTPLDSVHFQTDIQPIFTANCILCHGGSKNPDLRDGNSYAALTTGGYINPPATAESSKLYKQIISTTHDSYTLSTEKQKILIWIQQGAKDN